MPKWQIPEAGPVLDGTALKRESMVSDQHVPHDGDALLRAVSEDVPHGLPVQRNH